MSGAADWAAELAALPVSTHRDRRPQKIIAPRLILGIEPAEKSFPTEEEWIKDRAEELRKIFKQWYKPISDELSFQWAEDDYKANPEEFPINWRWQTCRVCGGTGDGHNACGAF